MNIEAEEQLKMLEDAIKELRAKGETDIVIEEFVAKQLLTSTVSFGVSGIVALSRLSAYLIMQRLETKETTLAE